MNTTSQQPVYLFDFDGTLFDTNALKKSIEKDLTPITTSFDTLWQIEKELRHTPTHIAETIKQFCEKEGLQDQIDQVQHAFLHQDFGTFLFPEVAEVLRQLKTQTLLCLFTQGDESFQQVKVYGSSVQQYFEKLFIYTDKMVHLTEIVNEFPNREIWFVDNQLKYLEKATQLATSIKTIWINRENLQNSANFTPTKVITTLTEIVTNT